MTCIMFSYKLAQVMTMPSLYYYTISAFESIPKKHAACTFSAQRHIAHCLLFCMVKTCLM